MEVPPTPSPPHLSHLPPHSPPPTHLLWGILQIAEQQEKLAREVEKRKAMVPIQVHRQHEQQLRDIQVDLLYGYVGEGLLGLDSHVVHVQGEKRKLKAQNDLLSQQIEVCLPPGDSSSH